MKALILKTVIASASVIILGTAAQADRFGYQYAEGDSCNTGSHGYMKHSKAKSHKSVKYKKVKRSSKVKRHSKAKRMAWGPKSKPVRQAWGAPAKPARQAWGAGAR